MTSKLNSNKATDRIAALKEITESSFSGQDKEHSIASVVKCLNDNSITVARQAVQTLARLGLAYAPEELKILARSAEDAKLKTLSIATIARIELEQKRQETGLVEWNMDEYVFSVGDFLVFINALLSHEIVHIKGEVFDMRVFRDNLVFFSLKDAEGVVNCWFPRAYQYQWNVELSEGIEVVVKVKPQVSPKSGRFGLRVLEIKLSGEGSLRLALDRLKAKLETEGLFDESRKRPLPFMPERIGLITGEDSAAYSDFVKVLKARMGGITIYHAPVRVQGVGSIAEICGAIEYFNGASDDPCDLLVLTRGGGSLEDLQSFNSEEVTRAVFSTKIPIVVAVGHEKDCSLAELAADLRASTPSNAAELIVPQRLELISAVNSWRQAVGQQMQGLIQERKHSVYRYVTTINSTIQRKLQYYHRLIQSLAHHFRALEASHKQKQEALIRVRAQAIFVWDVFFTNKQHTLNTLQKLLTSYSPREVQKRGYSVVKHNGKIIKSSEQVARGDTLEIWPYKGKIVGKVTEQTM